jgi:hypothetical protein
MNLDPVPGAVIRWEYSNVDLSIGKNAIMWSTIDKRYVPIGSDMIHLCIACDGKTITWLNQEGLFRARVDDGTNCRYVAFYNKIVPRLILRPLRLVGFLPDSP